MKSWLIMFFSIFSMAAFSAPESSAQFWASKVKVQSVPRKEFGRVMEDAFDVAILVNGSTICKDDMRSKEVYERLLNLAAATDSGEKVQINLFQCTLERVRPTEYDVYTRNEILRKENARLKTQLNACQSNVGININQKRDSLEKIDSLSRDVKKTIKASPQ